MDNFSINRQIMKLRKEKGLTGEMVAKELSISKATYYRYEKDGTKVPAEVLHQICNFYHVAPDYFFRPSSKQVATANSSDSEFLPGEFRSPQEAMEFLLKLPLFASFGEYDPANMDEQDIINFSNEVLEQLKLVSYKYKK